MISNKIVILGVDALEYDLVTEWDMRVFKQHQFGKISVPILKKHGEPVTAVVWAGFISGKTPEETNITRFKDWKNPILPILDVLAKKMGVSLKHRLKVGEFLNKIGFKKSIPTRERYKKVGTIFSDILNSKAISAPSYNEDPENFQVRKELVYALEGKIDKKYLAEKTYGMDKQRVNEVISSIPGYDLICAHLFSLDTIQHMYSRDMDTIKSYYQKMEQLVESVKNQMKNTDICLIISDHGQKKGRHTDYGFYSLNTEVKCRIDNILQFRELISSSLLKVD